MLEKMSSVRIKGGYFVNETGEFPLFKNAINILYGRNGSGKSSISRAIREFAKFGVEDSEARKFAVQFDAVMDKSHIHVFNEDFVKEKVLVDGEGVGTIVMFGKQVEVDKKIEELRQQQDGLNGNYTKSVELRAAYNDAKNNTSPLFYKKALRDSLREWANLDSKLRNPNAKIGSKVTDEVFNMLFSQKTAGKSENLRHLQQQLDSELKLYRSTSNAVKIFWPKEKLSLPVTPQQILNLLNQHIEKPTLSERDKIIISIAESKYSKYINESNILLADSELHVCPLCQREITELEKSDLKSRISKFFDKRAEEYKAKLTDILVLLQNVEPSLPFVSSNVLSAYIGVVSEYTYKINSLFEKISVLVHEKLTNIYTDTHFDFDVTELDVAIIDYNKACDQLSIAIAKYNTAIDDRDKLKQKLIEINNKVAYLQNRTLLESYFKAYVALENNEKQIHQLSANIDKIKHDIFSLEQEKKQVKIALDFINQALRYIFYDKNRLLLVEGEGCYRLKSKGCDVQPKDVSLGERNIIGLCYYFASLFEGKSEDEKYKDEILAVIDDPVSSFDFENRIGVISFLKWQLGLICKGNAHSKALVLTHDIQVALDLFKANEAIIDKKQKLLILSDCQVVCETKRKDASEYKQMLKAIFEFAESDTALDENFTIGNQMRKVLEAYFSFNYANGYTNNDCLDMVLKGSPNKEYFKNTMVRLLLNGESHSEEQVKAMSCSFGLVSNSEKHRVAKDVLCLLYSIDSNHLKFVLGDAAVRQIKQWLGEIEVL